MKFLLSLLAVFCAVARAEKYDFQLNSQPVQPHILSISAVIGAQSRGDVAMVGGLSFILGEPGPMRFQQLASDRNRLWNIGEDGKRVLIACRVSRDYSKDKAKVVNPLATLNDAQLRALRGVEIDGWEDGIEKALAKLDAANCFIGITQEAGRGKPKTMPKLPAATRYLRIAESSSDNIKDLSGLKELTELELFSYHGYTEGFDLALIAGATKMRALSIGSGSEPLRSVSTISKLTHLRTLGLNGLKGQKDVSFLRGLDELRTLNLDRSSVEDLSALGDFRAISRVDADESAVSKLPGKAVPTLVRLHAIGTRLAEKDAVEFGKLNPHCEVTTGWLSALQSGLKGVTRIRVRSGGVCHRRTGEEKTLVEVKEAAAIAEIVGFIGLDEEESGGHCMCCGEPSIEFYTGDKLVVTLAVHHGIGMRWQEGWPSDARLLPRSSDALTAWLAKNGIKGPAEELAGNRASEAAAKRRAVAIQATVPVAAWDALQKATSAEDAANAFVKNIPDEIQRAEVLLRMFGCDYGSWSHHDQWDELVKGSLLPRVPSAVLAKAKIEAGSQAANGLARWLFFERKWEEWKRAELDAVFEVTARDGLLHPREANRRKTLLAIGGIGGDGARKLLTAVLRKEIQPRQLPEGREAEVGGMVTFMPEPQEIPEDCPDHVHAAIWLARMKDATTRSEIEKLAVTLKEKERSVIERALRTK